MKLHVLQFGANSSVRVHLIPSLPPFSSLLDHIHQQRNKLLFLPSKKLSCSYFPPNYCPISPPLQTVRAGYPPSPQFVSSHQIFTLMTPQNILLSRSLMTSIRQYTVFILLNLSEALNTTGYLFLNEIFSLGFQNITLNYFPLNLLLTPSRFPLPPSLLSHSS